MLKRAAVIFGAIFVVVGILGFVPAVAPPAPDGEGALLLGIFAVNGVHNLVHLLSGVIALVVGMRSEAASRMYFRVFGVIYALVAVVGVFDGSAMLLGMAHNMADAVLHVAIAAIALYLGFAHGPLRHAHEPPHHAA